ncbi:MAG TPA: site-2 protease family protein [Acidimicrobiales bacterium]|nr:site-2 protease family protein [Acidimicrobiales bacterium]
MSDAWGSPGQRPQRSRLDPRVLFWVGVVAVVFVVLGATHHVSSSTVIYLCVLIPSAVLHEIAHGAVANLLGDDTAKRAGRLSLNPVRHLDPLGSIILPGMLVLSSALSGGAPLAFGWAKPVPVNMSRLRHPRNGSIWVSLAGPATNALLLVVCGLLFRYWLHHNLFLPPGATTYPLAYQVLIYGGLANITLCVFNLLPIPPLDGSVLIERLLPPRALGQYFRLRPYGMLLVFVIAFVGLRNPAVQSHLFDGELHLWNAVSGAAL